MHRTIIEQNKIKSIICSCLIFCPVNIYRPSLENVRLGRPNPNLSQSLNIHLRRKKNIILRIVGTPMYRRPIFNFHLFRKNYFKKCIIKPVKMFNYIYNNY